MSIATDKDARHEELTDRIRARLGVLPAFFSATDGSLTDIQYLWNQAEYAYLDNPLPSLFKEKVFAYLSRFCMAKYCVARHSAFLMGQGYIAGDPESSPLRADDVLSMLARPLVRHDELQAHVDSLASPQSPVSDWLPGSDLEASLLNCTVPIFLHDHHPVEKLFDSPTILQCKNQICRLLGNETYNRYLGFLSYIRTEHEWAELHPELDMDPDVEQLLVESEGLAKWIASYPRLVSTELSEIRIALLNDIRDRFLDQTNNRIAYPWPSRTPFRTGYPQSRSSRAWTHKAPGYAWSGQGQLKNTSNPLPTRLWVSTPGNTCSWASRVWLELVHQQTLKQKLSGDRTVGIHPEDIEERLQIWNEAYRRHEPFLTEFRLGRGAGPYRWVCDFGQPVIKADGSFDGYIGACIDINERKDAEHTARTNEERYVLATRATTDYIWEYELDKRTVWRSETSERAWGPRPQDLDKSVEWWHSRVHPDDRERTTGSLWSTVRGTGDYWQCDYRLRRPNGEYAHVHDRAYISRDADGKPLRVVGALRDVTESRNDEKKLRESEERYRMMFEQAAVGVAHMNSRTGEFLQINQRYCDLVGYSEQELIGKNFKYLTHPDDLQHDLDDMVRLRAGEIREFTKEKRYFHKNGSVVWIALTVSPMWHPGEEPSTHIAIVQDITPRKQADKALRETKDRLQFLISDSPTVIYTSTPSGDFGATFVSKNVTKLLGYKPNEFVDRSTFWIEHVHPDDVAHVINALPTLVKNGRHRFEYRFEHKQGGYRWIYDEPKVVRNSNGGLEEIIGYMIDITERKQAEQILRERDDQMRALVKRLEKIQEAERTAISREIHDALGQAFTALQLDLSWFIEELVEIPFEVRERIESMLNILQESGDTLRRISSSLRPAALDDLGLEVAIEWTAEVFAQRSNLECVVSTVSVSPMEDERKTAVFRIFQEALTNIVRHGQARRFAVLLELKDGICTLVVEDDGIGIEEEKISSSQSIGLIGMRERAAWFGGELDIARKCDGGTAITLRMPIVSG